MRVNFEVKFIRIDIGFNLYDRLKKFISKSTFVYL